MHERARAILNEIARARQGGVCCFFVYAADELRVLGERLNVPSSAKKLADQFMMIYDGASVAAQMDRNGLAAATSARTMAAMLLDAAI